MDKQREDKQTNSEIDRWTDNGGTNRQRERQMDEQRETDGQTQRDRWTDIGARVCHRAQIGARSDTQDSWTW